MEAPLLPIFSITENLWAVYNYVFKKQSFYIDTSGFRVSKVVSFKFCSMPAFPVTAYLCTASLDFVKQGAHGKRWAAVWNTGRQRQFNAAFGDLIVQTLAFSVVSLYINSVGHFPWKVMCRNQSGLQNLAFYPVGDGFCFMISVGLISMLEVQSYVFCLIAGCWVWPAFWS